MYYVLITSGNRGTGVQKPLEHLETGPWHPESSEAPDQLLGRWLCTYAVGLFLLVHL